MNVVHLEVQACKDSPDLRVHLVFLVRKANAVSLEPRVNKVTPVPSVILVNLVHLVCKDWWDQRVPVVNLATRVIKDLWDLLDELENRVPLDHKDLLDPLAQPVCLVSRDNLVTMVAQVMQDHLDNQEPQERKARKENKAAKDLLDLSDSLVRKALLVIEDSLGFQDPSVLLVLADCGVQLVKLDLQADPETKAPLDLLVLSDPLALLVHPVNPDLKAHLVKKDPPVLEAALETKAPLALLDLLDLLDLLVYLDLLDNLVLLVLLENVDPLVKLARWVLKALLDPVVSPVSKESKENVASVESLELKAPKVIAVSLVYKVFPAHSAPKETEDLWVLPDLLANLVNLDLKVLLVVTEALGPKVSWVLLDPAVLLVNLVNQVLLVLPVPLDLRDPLVNQWVTMLPHWLLFLDKVHPRDLIQWLVMIRLASLPN